MIAENASPTREIAIWRQKASDCRVAAEHEQSMIRRQAWIMLAETYDQNARRLASQDREPGSKGWLGD